MVLVFLRHLISQYPDKRFYVEATPKEYTRVNMVHVEKHGVYLEIDCNMYGIYIEPRARSLLVIVEHQHKPISTEYHKFLREVVCWKSNSDTDYDWVKSIIRINTIKFFDEDSKKWAVLELECVVCMKAEEQCYTPCGHVVCQKCLVHWCRRNKLTCPMCRAQLTAQFMNLGII
jgi:hypothetical protein